MANKFLSNESASVGYCLSESDISSESTLFRLGGRRSVVKKKKKKKNFQAIRNFRVWRRRWEL